MTLFDMIKDVLTTSDAEKAQKAKEIADQAQQAAADAQAKADEAQAAVDQANAASVPVRMSASTPAPPSPPPSSRHVRRRPRPSVLLPRRRPSRRPTTPTSPRCAVAAAAAAAATAHAAELRTYTVVSGDTLSGIGHKFGVSYQDIAKLNHIANPDLIYPGQVFKIPHN